MNENALFQNHYDIFAPAAGQKETLLLPLGLNDEGILEQVEITDAPDRHLLIAGHAGSGKSNYLHTVLASLLLNYTAQQLALWLCDSGLWEFHHFTADAPPHIHRVDTGCEPADYAGFTDALEGEIQRRLRCLSQAEKTSYGAYCRDASCSLPRLVVMIDSFDSFLRGLSEAGHGYIQKLEGIVRCASACGVTFMITTQEAADLAQQLSPSFMELFGIRLATKQSTNSYCEMFHPGVMSLARKLTLGEVITGNPTCRKLRMLYITQPVEQQIIQFWKNRP